MENDVFECIYVFYAVFFKFGRFRALGLGAAIERPGRTALRRLAAAGRWGSRGIFPSGERPEFILV